MVRQEERIAEQFSMEQSLVICGILLQMLLQKNERTYSKKRVFNENI